MASQVSIFRFKKRLKSQFVLSIMGQKRAFTDQHSRTRQTLRNYWRLEGLLGEKKVLSCHKFSPKKGLLVCLCQNPISHETSAINLATIKKKSILYKKREKSNFEQLKPFFLQVQRKNWFSNLNGPLVIIMAIL